MQDHSLRKIASLVASAGGLMLVGVIVFQVGVAFGWTNPLGNPPAGTGAIGVTGGKAFVGPGGPFTGGTPTAPTDPVLTVNGELSAAGNKITDVATPTNTNDAVNLGYVQAQVGGGGGMITLYGTAGGVGPWSSFQAGVKTFKNCLLGGGAWCTVSVNAIPMAGQGLTCPANAPTLVYKGYGPYAYIQRNYYYTAPKPPGSYAGGPATSIETDDPNKPDPPTDVPLMHLPRYFGVTYSVCGQSTALVAQHDYAILDNGTAGPGNITGIGEAAGILSACSPNGQNTYACNVCIVCK